MLDRSRRNSYFIDTTTWNRMESSPRKIISLGFYYLFCAIYLYFLGAVILQVFLDPLMLEWIIPTGYLSYRTVLWILGGLLVVSGLTRAGTEVAFRDLLIYLHAVLLVLLPPGLIYLALAEFTGASLMDPDGSIIQGYHLLLVAYYGVVASMVAGRVFTGLGGAKVLQGLSVASVLKMFAGSITSRESVKPISMKKYQQRRLSYRPGYDGSLLNSIGTLGVFSIFSAVFLIPVAFPLEAAYGLVASDPTCLSPSLVRSLVFKPVKQALDLSPLITVTHVFVVVIAVGAFIPLIGQIDSTIIQYQKFQKRVLGRFMTPVPEPRLLREFGLILFLNLPMLVLAFWLGFGYDLSGLSVSTSLC